MKLYVFRFGLVFYYNKNSFFKRKMFLLYLYLIVFFVRCLMEGICVVFDNIMCYILIEILFFLCGDFYNFFWLF